MRQIFRHENEISERPSMATGLTKRVVFTGRPSRLALVDGTGSVAEAGEGAARHTRAWSVGAPAVVADCRRLRYGPARICLER